MQLNPQEMSPVVNRLRRAQGQLGGILAMIEDGRECEDVVTQLAAVSKAIDRAAFAIIAQTLRERMQECVNDPQVNPSEAIDVAKLEKLFLSLA